MSLKLLFGILSVIPAVVAYSLYFRGMFAGRTKPHAFSWLVWGLLAGNGFLAQVSASGGIGAWVTGLTSVASLAIACFALGRGSIKPAAFDWALLGLALAGLLLLLVVKNQEVAVGLTIFALTMGFVMNIRKVYYKPQEEDATAFWLNAVKFVPSIFALTSMTFLTVAYPLVAIAGNVAVALVVQIRSGRFHSKRRQPTDSLAG